MSRRGLVSKNLGGPGASNAALMPKGEKPAGKPNLTVDAVATKLKVSPKYVREWIDSDILRGTEAGGVKAYDFETFRLKPDNQAEIRKAQSKTAQESSKKDARKPEKTGFFSKFRSIIFKAENEPPAKASHSLQKENRELRAELKKLKSNSTGKGKQNNDLEEKVRYLEQKLGKVTALEEEITDLKIQLAGSKNGGSSEESGALKAELQTVQSKLNRAEAQLEQKAAEVLELQSIREAQTSEPSASGEELELLKHQLEQAQAELRTSTGESQRQQQELAQLNEALEQAQAASSETVPTSNSEDEALIDELLEVQACNLRRFKHLSQLHAELKVKLEAVHAERGESREESAELEKLKSEFQSLRLKHRQLLEAKNESDPGQRELVEQLAAARVAVTKLKQESSHLKARLSDSEVAKWKAKSEDFERRLAQAQKEGGGVASNSGEIKALKKAIQSKENQLQNMTSRLQENEKALDKAMDESSRLTGLLIERENRLRDVSSDFEREYQQKIETLDRQVSGLQWKLSLREERIAQLESELTKNLK